MSIQTAESISKAVTDRLALYLPLVEVREVQNRETFKLTHPVATIITHYIGSQFDNNRTITFGVYVVTRFREEAYRYLEAVRIALNGWQIEGAGKFCYQADEFVSEDQGIWQYNLTFTVVTGAMPIADVNIAATLAQL